MTIGAPKAATIHLSRTQAAFVADPRRYSGFGGGIGSGKSYAGAAKALMHHLVRPGLGLVYSPTYPMLRDATWRTALEVWAPLIAEVARHEMRVHLRTGAEVLFRSADDPDRLRGPNADWAWIDEGSLCHPDTFPVVIGRLRAGGSAGPCWVTFTPKGAMNWTYRVFVTDANENTSLHRASTRSNPFIAVDYVTGLEGQYTERTARQELGGEFLTDTPGALWDRATLDDHRVRTAPDLTRVVVGVDPAVSSGDNADETGIIVAGRGVDGHAYILADASCRLSPDGWARRVINAYHEHHGDRIVAEVNNGGDLVERVLRTVDKTIAYTAVHASRGKRTRAEPIAALFEQGKVHHVGAFPRLEDQMVSFVPDAYDGSPDRCFVAGTLIKTDRGDVPIEDVSVGMRAWTRTGWRPIVAAGRTNRDAAVAHVTFSDGRSLTGTGNHPVYVHGKGFTPLNALVWGDTIEACERPLFSTIAPSSATRTARQNRRSGTFMPSLAESVRAGVLRFTKRHGRRSTVPFLLGATFITVMATRSTMTSVTWSASRDSNTPRIMLTPSVARNNWSILGAFGHWRPRGIALLPGASGTVSMGRQRGSAESQPTASVLSVGPPISPSRNARAIDFALDGASFVTPREPIATMKTERVLSAARRFLSRSPKRSGPAPVSVVQQRDAGRTAVYNLTVAGTAEYYAGGVLVHNCDALVYALTELMLNNRRSATVY